MSDIELAIKIPEKIYKYVQQIGSINMLDTQQVANAIFDGTPFPKGHGRILDEKDILDTKNNDGDWYDLVDMPEYIAGVKAIIEADKEQEE